MAAAQHRAVFLGRRRVRLLSWSPNTPFDTRCPNNTVSSITRRHHSSPSTLLLLQRRAKSTLPFNPIKFSYNGYAKLTSDPLRILFCGSDDFSAVSLRALYALQQLDPALIESIDVLVRPGKPVGRGRKHVHTGPLHLLARDKLRLPVHQRDTFTGWDLPLCGHVRCPRTGEKTCFPHPTRLSLEKRPPQRFNLIIAVSFGLFVPPRILHSVKYGGLNVHPSLLPDLRGPAPLQWTILARRPVTGVTLQTLHPAEYDRGIILAQTPAPGIPVPEDVTLSALHETLAAEGAKLLVQGLKREVHVPPYEKRGGWWPPLASRPSSSSSPSSPSATENTEDTTIQLRDAPKMTRQDEHVDWRCHTWGADKTLYPLGQLTAEDIERRARAMGLGGGPRSPDDDGNSRPRSNNPGGLWSHALVNRSSSSSSSRRSSSPHSLSLVKDDSKDEYSLFAAQDKRIILTDIEAVPCPPTLHKTVRMIVQVRRSVLLLSAQEDDDDGDEGGGDFDENYFNDDVDHDHDHVRHGGDGGGGGGSGFSNSTSSAEVALRDGLKLWKQVGPDMKNIGSIAWSMPEDPRSNAAHQAVRLPVLLDRTDFSVTIPVGVPIRIVDGKAIAVIGEKHPLDALKIKFAKVAGSDDKPAAVALAQFLEVPLKPKQVVEQDEYAIDVMARRLD